MMETNVKRMPIGIEMDLAEAPSAVTMEPSASELAVTFEFGMTGNLLNEL
jgi:hypothetical protein